jgi:hypothetical protein
MTPDEGRDLHTIASALIGTGLNQSQLELLVELMAAMSTRLSGGNRVESPDGDAAERRRAWDRQYRREKRRGAKPPASTLSTRHPPDIHPTKVDSACNLLTSLKKETSEEVREVSKKRGRAEVVERAKKGTRLSSDALLSELDREFARGYGFSDSQIDGMWSEFVDYWIAIPGQRGVKLNWSSTWRNRIRQIGARNGAHQPRPGGVAAAAEAIGRGLGGGSHTARVLSLSQGRMERPGGVRGPAWDEPRAISKRGD